jgi:predicted RND superfamily exporter protein
MIAPLAAAYQALILDKPVWVLLVVVLLTSWLASHLPNTRFDASSDSLVLEGDTDLAYSREIGARYAAEDFLLVTYRPEGDLFSDVVLDRLQSLQDRLAQIESVSSINSILSVPLLYSPQVDIADIGDGLRSLTDVQTDRSLARKEFSASPIYRDLLTNADASVTALQLNLQRDHTYFALLDQREALRALQQRGQASAADMAELKQAEQAFRDYVLVANARQEMVVAEVRSVLDNYRDDAEIFLGGVPMIAVDMIHFVKSDLAVFGSGIIAFIVMLMAFIFRRLRWVIIPLACCMVTALGMIGWMALIDWRLTVISSNFVAILLIINLSILIHLVVRYRELAEQRPEDDQRQLVWQTVSSMARPCLYTALTTIVAFGSLVVSGIRPVIDFGWMMTIGVSVALLVSFVLLPAVLMVLPREGSFRQSTGRPFTDKFAVVAERHGVGVIMVAVVLSCLSGVGISRIQVENRFIDYFSSETEIYQGMETIDRELGGTIPLDVIIDVDPEELAQMEQEATYSGGFGDDLDDLDEAFADELADDDFFDDADMFASDQFASGDGNKGGAVDKEAVNVWFTRRGLTQVTEVHNYLDSLPEVGKVLSLATFYQVVDDLLGGKVDDVQLAIVGSKLPDVVADVLVNPYYDADKHQVRISMRAMETSHSLQRDLLLKQIHSHLVNELGFKPEQVHLTGMLVLYNNMLQSLYRSQILTIGAVFLAIMVMFLILFRSLSLALIAITPNMLAAAMVLGGMGLAGIPLDLMTITIAAICIGIGVDDTINYLHRYKVEFARDNDYSAAMHRSHGSIGKAMYYTSVIIVFGFGMLTLSNFTPSIYFGLLTGAAMLAALMGALLLLPRLIVIFKPFGKLDALS